MFYTVYKTINLVNGNFYIGYHKTTNPFDSYLGSGVSLQSAINKYGKDKFSKILLYIGLDEALALELEKVYIGWQYFSNPMCYNQTIGGGKPPSQKGTHNNLGLKRSDATKLKLRMIKLGVPQTPESVAKRSKSNTGKKRTPEFSVLQSKIHKGKHVSEESKIRIKEASVRRWETLRRLAPHGKGICELCGAEFSRFRKVQRCCSDICSKKRYDIWQRNQKHVS